MRESAWTQRLRTTYAIPDEVAARNVVRACAPKLADKASAQGDSAEVRRLLESYALDLLDAARRLGDAGFLDEMFVRLRPPGYELNLPALLSACVVLLHQDNDTKSRVGAMCHALLDHLEKETTETTKAAY